MMKFKRVMTIDRRSRHVRLFRLTRDVGEVGDGKGYSEQVSVGLVPRLLWASVSRNDVIATVFGVRLHWQRSYGGRYA